MCVCGNVITVKLEMKDFIEYYFQQHWQKIISY